MRVAILLWWGALLALSTAPAFAAPVRVEFSGVVEAIDGRLEAWPNGAVSPDDAEALLGGSIRVGTRFSGFFLYDDAALTSDSDRETEIVGGPATREWSLYFLPNDDLHNQAGQMHGEIGDYAGTGDWLTFDVWDNEDFLEGAAPSEVFVTGGVDPPAVGDVVLQQIWIYVCGAAPGAPLHGASLSDSIPWTLAGFPQASASWLFSDGTTQVRVTGALDRPVPEPSGASLMALGACLLLGVRSAWRVVPRGG